MSERTCCPNDNPAPICFEEDVCGFIITGCKDGCPTMTVYEGPVPAPCPTPPCPDPVPNSTSLIRNTQKWHVGFAWKQDGPTSELMVGAWEVAVYLHRVDAVSVIKKIINVDHVPRCGHCYTINVEFDANEVQDGLYEIFGSVGFEVKGKAYAAISGLGYGPILKVYTPK